MLDVGRLKLLGVGDIVEHQRHKKELRKKEIIENAKDLYGDNIPDSIFDYLERQLKLIPKVETAETLSPEDIQYLVWLSLRKNDPDVTLKQAGDWLNLDELDLYVSKIFPAPETLPEKTKKSKKKVAKKTRKKKKKNN